MAVRRKPLSARVITSLRAKAKTRKNITLGQLKTVFRRGQAAWLTGSRPRIGMQQWAMARVNSYLRGSRKHDTDLRRIMQKQTHDKINDLQSQINRIEKIMLISVGALISSMAYVIMLLIDKV